MGYWLAFKASLVQQAVLTSSAMDSLSGIPDRLKNILMPFQTDGVRFAIQKNGRCLIADEMGLGKTLQALAVAVHYSEEWPLLIIVPSSLKFSWVEEIERWLPHLQPQDVNVVTSGIDVSKHIHGSWEKKIRDPDVNVVSSGIDVSGIATCQVTIATYGLLSKTTSSLVVEALTNQNFRVVIADESHYLRNQKTASCKVISPLIQNAQRRILLSGTPALSRPVELYPQINCILPGTFGTWWDFTTRFCDAHYEFFGQHRRRNVKGASNLSELQSWLRSSVMIRREKKHVLTQLPPKQRQKILFDIKQSPQKNELLELFEDLRPELRKSLNVHTVDSSGVSMLAKLQRVYHLSCTVKIGPVCEYIRVLLDNHQLKFLVFAHHRVMMDAIEQCVTEAKVKAMRIDGSVNASDRLYYVNQFQSDPDCRVAILSILAAGVGLTLTAAPLIVFAEMHWTPGMMIQCEDRAHRIGQTSAVSCHYLVAKDTMDEWVWATINRKSAVVTVALNGKCESLAAYRGERYQIDVLSNADVIDPEATDFTPSNAKVDIDAFFLAHENPDQPKIMDFFAKNRKPKTKSPTKSKPKSPTKSKSPSKSKATSPNKSKPKTPTKANKLSTITAETTKAVDEIVISSEDEEVFDTRYRKKANHDHTRNTKINRSTKKKIGQADRSLNDVVQTDETKFNMKYPNEKLDRKSMSRKEEVCQTIKRKPSRSSKKKVGQPSKIMDELYGDNLEIVDYDDDDTDSLSENESQLLIDNINAKYEALCVLGDNKISLTSSVDTGNDSRRLNRNVTSDNIQISRNDVVNNLMDYYICEDGSHRTNERSTHFKVNEKCIKDRYFVTDSPAKTVEVSNNDNLTEFIDEISALDESYERVDPSKSDSVNWSCSLCTFINHSEISSCEMCDTPRKRLRTLVRNRSDGTPGSAEKSYVSGRLAGADKRSYTGTSGGSEGSSSSKLRPVWTGLVNTISNGAESNAKVTDVNMGTKGIASRRKCKRKVIEENTLDDDQQTPFKMLKTENDGEQSVVVEHGVIVDNLGHDKLNESESILIECKTEPSECDRLLVSASMDKNVDDKNHTNNEIKNHTNNEIIVGSNYLNNSLCSDISNISNSDQNFSLEEHISGMDDSNVSLKMDNHEISDCVTNIVDSIEIEEALVEQITNYALSNENNDLVGQITNETVLNYNNDLVGQIANEMVSNESTHLNHYDDDNQNIMPDEILENESALKIDELESSTVVNYNNNSMEASYLTEDTSLDEENQEVFQSSENINNCDIRDSVVDSESDMCQIESLSANDTNDELCDNYTALNNSDNCDNLPRTMDNNIVEICHNSMDKSANDKVARTIDTAAVTKHVQIVCTDIENSHDDFNELDADIDITYDYQMNKPRAKSDSDSRRAGANDITDTDEDGLPDSCTDPEAMTESENALTDTYTDTVKDACTDSDAMTETENAALLFSQITDGGKGDTWRCVECGVINDADDCEGCLEPRPADAGSRQENTRHIDLDSIPMYDKFLFGCSQHTGRIYLFDGNREPLAANFLPLDIDMDNQLNLPDVLMRSENLRLVKTFMHQWRMLSDTKKRYLVKQGGLLCDPVEDYQQLKLGQTSSTHRSLTKESLAADALTTAAAIDGSVRCIQKRPRGRPAKSVAAGSSQSQAVDTDSQEVSGVVQPLASDGTPLCLNCHLPVTSPLITSQSLNRDSNAWLTRLCSPKCMDQYWMKTQPSYCREKLSELEHGVCQLCGVDAHRIYTRIRTMKDMKARAELLQEGPFKTLRAAQKAAMTKNPVEGQIWKAIHNVSHHPLRERTPTNLHHQRLQEGPFKTLTAPQKAAMTKNPVEGQFWHADHIRPVWEGGGLCDIDNLRTLCTVCHKKVSQDQTHQRTRARKLQQGVKCRDIASFFTR